jgi:uncharacterized protein (DUF885 family)
LTPPPIQTCIAALNEAEMSDDTINRALRIADDARTRIELNDIQPLCARLPDLSLEGAKARAEAGRAILRDIAALRLEALPAELRLTIEIIRGRAEYWAVQEDWYWTVFDPSGGEMFAMFAPTPYGGGMAIASVARELARMPLESDAARFRYLSALADFGVLLDQFAARTRGQAERGIYMPRAQAEAALRLLERWPREHGATLQVSDTRLPGHDAFKRDVTRMIDAHVLGGFARLTAVLDASYMGSVSDSVGMMHYPDGAEIYASLVRWHGSTTLSPQEVHELGLGRIAAIRADMAKVRAEARFDGDDHAYRAHLDADPAWRADTPEAIAAVFRRYIDRLAPHLPDLFNTLPRATYGVRPLPDALTEAMTFGYYDPSTREHPHGDYVFNARNLAKAGLFNLAALNYHELAPGHHLHLALQTENESLPWLRSHTYPTAYVEGWAEYAATLAGEIGMYENPPERFGRLVSEAFLACRLVVDTGMNALGWSLEQARAFMRDDSFMPETEIRSETLRYSSDIPGQALAYKLGEFALQAMRTRMAKALGDRFALADFHDAVLGVGAIPLPLLERHIDTLIAAQRAPS